MELGALSLDRLLREFREDEFKRVLAAVGDVERLLHLGFSYGQRAAVYCRRLDDQLGGLGGYALHHDAGFIARVVGEGDCTGVGTCLGGGVGEVEFHLGACREAALYACGSAEVRQRRCDVVAVKGCRP